VADDVPAAYIPLPAHLHDPGHTAGRVFDRIAAQYDAARPGYPQEAIAGLAAECRLGPGSQVLEVGCGTGQATRALAAFGCAIRCLEPGPHLAELARHNLRASPNVEVVVDAFESAHEPYGSFDAVVSATAFHWIDPRVSYAKAASLLGPGGHLALLTNAHAAGGSEDLIVTEVQDLHARLAPEIGAWRFPSVEALCRQAHEGGDIAAVWTRVDRKLGDPPAVDQLFRSPRVTTYPWVATYDHHGYAAMLETQSSYALMGPDTRDRMMAAVGRLIDERLGGTITKQYVCILAIAEVRHADGRHADGRPAEGRPAEGRRATSGTAAP
jgi:SAM-dependent methyltransferase